MADIEVTGDIVDIDAMAAASREKAKQTYQFRFLGRLWQARNAVPFGQVARSITEDMGLEAALGTLAAFVVEDQREEFTQAVLDSDDVFLSDLKLLGEAFNKRTEDTVGNAAT